MSELKALQEKVNDYMLLHYNVSVYDMDLSTTPGYWQDKQAKIHEGHPLHSCLSCQGPFKATYTFFDSRKDGKFLSPTRTWKRIKELQPITC